MMLDFATTVLSLCFLIFLPDFVFVRRFHSKCKVQLYVSFIFMIICLICTIYVVIHKETFTYLHLLGSLLASLTNAYLMKKKDATDADINNCQKDSEGIGALWAHQAYIAYYRHVLQTIKERINVFEKEKDSKFLIKKLIVIIPLSCDVESVLTYKDENIKEFGFLPPLECDQGANINRQFKNPVYEIEFIHKIVYIAAEYPSTLNTLWKIKNDIGKEKFKYHRDCFIRTLKYLVKDTPCIVVEYDDANHPQEPLRDFLLLMLRKTENTFLPLE